MEYYEKEKTFYYKGEKKTNVIEEEENLYGFISIVKQTFRDLHSKEINEIEIRVTDKNNHFIELITEENYDNYKNFQEYFIEVRDNSKLIKKISKKIFENLEGFSKSIQVILDELKISFQKYMDKNKVVKNKEFPNFFQIFSNFYLILIEFVNKYNCSLNKEIIDIINQKISPCCSFLEPNGFQKIELLEIPKEFILNIDLKIKNEREEKLPKKNFIELVDFTTDKLINESEIDLSSIPPLSNGKITHSFKFIPKIEYLKEHKFKIKFKPHENQKFFCKNDYVFQLDLVSQNFLKTFDEENNYHNLFSDLKNSKGNKSSNPIERSLNSDSNISNEIENDKEDNNKDKIINDINRDYYYKDQNKKEDENGN